MRSLARSYSFQALLARGFEAVLRREILCEHRARQIESQDDVDSRARDVLHMRATARPRERNNEGDNHEIAKKQMRGYGGMICFELRGVDLDAAAVGLQT